MRNNTHSQLNKSVIVVLRTHMLPFFASLYLKFVAFTSRIRATSTSDDAIHALREKRAVVYTYWNQHVLFLLYYFGRSQMPMLMTPKAKTDTLTRLAEKMGLRVAKGSSEGGGRHALITLLEQLKQGHAVALAADGSRGPEHKCKAGSFILAQESGVALIPVACRAKYSVRIKRNGCVLDVPLPFNSIEIILAAPMAVTKHHEFSELDAIKNQLATQLDRLSEPTAQKP